ncbi:MAG: hypothetical protein ACYCZJ_13185 [Sulfuriferula sp.]
MSGGGGSTTSKSIAEPPAETKPYLAPYLDRANALSTAPYQNYGGQTVAGLNQDQNTAFSMVRNRATNGSPVQGMANYDAYQTLQGKYLDPASNPWLSKTYNAAATDMKNNFNNTVMPSVNSTFSLAGRYGSGAHQTAVNNAQNTLGRELGNMGTQIYGTNYGNERQNQMATMQAAPGLASADYADASALMGAGDAQRAFQQQNLADAYKRWQDAKQAPYTNLDVMGNAIQTTMGAGGTTTAYGRGNNTGQLVGAGLTAAGLLA